MSGIPIHLQVLWLAVLIDLALGDPPNVFHPVAWIGGLISAFQQRAPKYGRWIPLMFGGIFVVAGIVVAVAVGRCIEWASSSVPLPCAVLAQAVALKLTFSIRGLARAGRAVKLALERGDLNQARQLLRCHLVSRDTSSLDESQVSAATIESLCENASDSCVAPWLCYAIAGLPGAFAYRFINTCDAMLGYRDPELEWLGKVPARLDDVINLVPSRLTAILIFVATFVLGGRTIGALQVWYRDRNLTRSPNAGHPMSAAAGALGIELEKVGHYRLGRGQRPPENADIARAQWLLIWIAILAVGAISSAMFIVH